MNIICSQKLLANKIGISQKAVSSKSTIDLLKGILLSASDSELRITGYDLEIEIETNMQVEVIEEGEIVTDARLFGDIIRKLPDSFVEIKTDNKNNVFINCGKSKFKINGNSSKDFPRLPKVNEENLYEIPQDTLKDMIKQTVFAVGQDQTKPLIMGELLEVSNSTVTLVALDGYRMAVRSCVLNKDMSNLKVVIPGKSLTHVSSLLSSEENVLIGFDEKNAMFVLNDIKITTRLLTGTFMDYKRMVANEVNTRIKLNTKELLNGVERASLLSQLEKNSLIRLSIKEEKVAIVSSNDKGKTYEEVSLELEGEMLDIAFNSRYLLEGIKAIESDEIYIEFENKFSPCIIKPTDGTKYIYLMLPVRTGTV